MIKLKDDEIFIYQEQSFPAKRNFVQDMFSNLIYPWKYCCTSNFIRNYEEGGNFSEISNLKRLSANNLDELISRLHKFIPAELKSKGKLLILSSNPFYHGFFESCDCFKKHIQEGVSIKELENFKKKYLSSTYLLQSEIFCAIKPIDLNRELFIGPTDLINSG